MCGNGGCPDELVLTLGATIDAVTTALQRGEHNVTAWRQGCRCSRCRRALHTRSKIWWATRQVRRGRDPASYVAAGRVRLHLEQLVADGWTANAIARSALVSPATVSRIRRAETRWCSRIVARSILAVT